MAKNRPTSFLSLHKKCTSMPEVVTFGLAKNNLHNLILKYFYLIFIICHTYIYKRRKSSD